MLAGLMSTISGTDESRRGPGEGGDLGVTVASLPYFTVPCEQ